MATASIPVDLFNPGQVFACLGFLEMANVLSEAVASRKAKGRSACLGCLEMANVLSGHAEGRFDWTNESDTRFELRAQDTARPVEAVLKFLVEARCERLTPHGYADPPPTKNAGKKKGHKKPARDGADELAGDVPICRIATFPAPKVDNLALPLRLTKAGCVFDVTHWCDASSRNSFKLFAGQQRSTAIGSQMLAELKALWKTRRTELLDNPLGLAVPLGGSSFKLDARKAWTAIDAGYSPDEQSQRVEASPVVEMLAAIGLEHARPDEFQTRQVRYGVWNDFLPPVLARPVLGGSRIDIQMRLFRFMLNFAGKNKIVTFADEEAMV